MKTVVIGEGSGALMETIMSVYPRHKIVVDRYIQSGDVMGLDLLMKAETWQYSRPALPLSNL